MASDSASAELKILLVEDSLGDAQAFKRAIKRHSPAASVCHVTSAEEAIAIFEFGCDFGLCIFDINLPRVSGLDLLAKVKPWRQSLPMMILSSSSSAAEITRAYALGADGYLIKPFDFGEYESIARFVCDCWFNGNPLPEAQAASLLVPPADLSRASSLGNA